MQSLRAISKNRILPLLLAFCGFLFLAANSWIYSHNQISVLDEGLYLYKGYLFSAGKYLPFQDYGPWTNQMPLAFLIPGWIEMLFGAGIGTGRAFAFILTLASAIGIWLIIQRISGSWPAALAIVTLAINPAALKIYSVATSQGLTTFLLVWCLYFTLGDNRKEWELLVGGVLAGMVVMVRINMLPLLPLIALYVWWEKGIRAALIHLAGILLIFLGIHITYWPNILKIWAKWLPLPFLRPWAAPKTTPTWNPDNPFGFRVASFFLAFRFHFVALAGAIVTWSMVSKEEIKKTGFYKQFVFLSVSLVALFSIHVWASLFNDYCVFCFPTYTAFFSSIGVILLFCSLPAMNFDTKIFPITAGFIALALTLLGITYSAEDSILALVGEDAYKWFLNLKLPLVNDPMVWQLLANKFALEKIEIIKLSHTWLPVLFLAIVLVALMLVALVSLRSAKYGKVLEMGLMILFIFGCVLTPTDLFSGFYKEYDCPGDLLPAYQKTGGELSAIIPNGSQIYWAGYSPIPLTYLPNVNIYPSQLHGGYSYRISNEDDKLLKYGWWNQSLKKKWSNEADFILVSGDGFSDISSYIAPENAYELVYKSDPQTCKSTSTLSLYRRK